MKTIVITGGPCAGKTTALKHIRKALSQKGYRVFCVSETATELINGGITPDNSPSYWHFQYYLSQIQRVKESVFKQRANQDNDIIICDRGLLDNKGYLSQEDFQRLCEVFDTTQEEIIQRYDAIFHLETTAKGKEEHYTTENNRARSESIQEAKELDEKMLEAWSSHPNHYVIANIGSFEEKMEMLLEQIDSYLEKEQKCHN